jgi:quercetin dioxygenase-like cupin family protein
MTANRPATSTPDLRHVPRGGGPASWVAGDTYTFKATGADTGGRLTVWEATVPPGAGPPPHLHLAQAEAYYLLEGELEVLVLDGERLFTAHAGDSVFIPRGTVHRFRNVSQSASRMLLWMTPAGFEGFLFRVGRPARLGEQAPPLTAEEIARSVAIAHEYGMEIRT